MEVLTSLEERIEIARALTYEGHRPKSCPASVKQCGCVFCRMRRVLDGHTIIPDPRQTLKEDIENYERTRN